VKIWKITYEMNGIKGVGILSTFGDADAVDAMTVFHQRWRETIGENNPIIQVEVLDTSPGVFHLLHGPIR